jgi:DNA-binding beta-propeller fold protein YncE
MQETDRSEGVVSLGGQLFHVQRSWMTLPEGVQLEGVSSVAVNSDDFIYVFHRASIPLLIVDQEGILVRSVQFRTPCDAHGIFISRDDRVVLVDRGGHEVVILDKSDSELSSLGVRDRPRLQQPFNHPAGVAIASDGDIYVSDGYANAAIHRFSADGELKGSWGRPGRGPGEFVTPHSIWIDQTDRVLVVDRENDRVQFFTREGDYLDAWTDFYHPMDIYERQDGMLYVSDQVPRLSMFAPDGALVGRCMPVPFGAHGIWGDSFGNLYLAEPYPMNRITRLAPVT